MNLVQIERQKKPLKPYLITAAIIPIFSLLLVYLMAIIAQYEMSEPIPNQVNTSSYVFFGQISFIGNVAGFVCLGATMLVKYVMEAYSERNIYLTLGYPVSRTKVFASKLFLCLSVIGIGVFVSIFVTNTLFFISESFYQLVDDQLSFQSVLSQLPLMFTGVILVIAICLIALFIGWLKNSIPLVIISAILLYSIPSNLFSSGNTLIMVVLAVVLFVISLVVVNVLKNKVLRLEA
ncbi:hypothetical protein JZO70_07120 [Enterococcus sp. 669A]|uniref:ABC transporter permease n=1 Tax=Candidatus Enterococcus moelleringii TaxID=2815325 RepID=A0ABS3L8G5_9ENTE|nr:hypothetical protein [Enterococcus sp. 669A]MBO1305924.1 hypothetical protein [Enterococcus sp. 669A]